jgi:hypothetical protein
VTAALLSPRLVLGYFGPEDSQGRAGVDPVINVHVQYASLYAHR